MVSKLPKLDTSDWIKDEQFSLGNQEAASRSKIHDIDVQETVLGTDLMRKAIYDFY